jgi:hypothetical protein
MKAKHGRWAVVAAAMLLGLVSGCSANGSNNTGTAPLPSFTEPPDTTPSLPGATTATNATASPSASGSASPTGSESPTASTSPSASAAPPQLRYQLDIQDGRGALKGGTAFAASELAANTGHAIPFNAVICGATSRRCAVVPTSSTTSGVSASPSPPPAGLPPKIGEVPTGARIRAKLNSADPAVEITELSSDATQPIIDDADAAEWEWSIKPTTEGSFALTLRFDVLESQSERLLVPTQTFRITLTATTTTGDRWRDVGRSTWDFLASVTGMIAAVGGASIFTGAAWVWRRVRRKRLGVVAGITDQPGPDLPAGPRPPVPPAN